MSLLAQHYDRLWGLNDDREITQELLAQSGGPLVDLGCATGRVLEFALEIGLPAIGIENDPEMVHVLRSKMRRYCCDLVHVIEGDFTAVPIAQTAGVITCVCNTYSMILDRLSRRATLATAARNLGVDGQMLIWILSAAPVPRFGQKELDTGGGLLSYRSDVRTDAVNEMRHFHMSLELGEHREEHHFSTRLISPQEMETDALQTGLCVRAFYGDFDRSPFSERSPFQIYVLAKSS